MTNVDRWFGAITLGEHRLICIDRHQYQSDNDQESNPMKSSNGITLPHANIEATMKLLGAGNRFFG